jgi:pimeloyl-ACP methyl ester carboxylesterase
VWWVSATGRIIGGTMSEVLFATASSRARLAYRYDHAKASGPGIFWLNGFKSDMAGTKAEAVAAAARASGRPCLRFDYSGHGRSEGNFADFTISNWLNDTLVMFLEIARGDQIVVGSSMGGHIALLLAKRLQETQSTELARIKGMVLIAPAADMTEALLWQHMDEAAKSELLERGQWLMPSRYGEAYPVTRKLIEDGRRHLILKKGLSVDFPVRILHGEDDPDVAWQHGLKLFSRLNGNDISFMLIKGGDHRLSSPRDLKTIVDTIEILARAQN